MAIFNPTPNQFNKTVRKAARFINPFKKKERSSDLIREANKSKAAGRVSGSNMSRMTQSQMPQNQSLSRDQMAVTQETPKVEQPKVQAPPTQQAQQQAPQSDALKQLMAEQQATAKGQIGTIRQPEQEATFTAAIEQPAPQPVQQQAPPRQSQLSALQQALVQSQTPTAEEAALADQIAQLRGAAGLAIAGEEGAGRGRTLDLIRGRQGRLQTQANLQTQTLEQRLANLQAQRQAQQQGIATQLGFEQQAAQAAAAQQQALAEQAKPFVVDGAVLQFDPLTGQIMTLREAPTEAAEPIKLSEGQVLVDPATNQIIAQAPQNALDQQKRQLEIQRLQQELSSAGISLSGEQIADAVGKGYKTDGQLELYKSIVSGGGVAPDLNFSSNEARKTRTTANEALTQLQEMKETLESKPLFTTAPGIATFFRNRGYRDASRVIQESLARLKSGAAITDFEFDLYSKRLPKFGDSPALVQDKLQDLQTFFADVSGRGSGGTSGGDALDRALEQAGFSNDLGTSIKGSILTEGKRTALGSPLWPHGLDIDLKKGDPVPSTVSGQVVFVGDNGGFGQQVQVRDRAGNTHWFSHLDAADVQKGQTVSAGQIIGKGGNTGQTIPGVGGDGSHLDYTIMLPDGTYAPPAAIDEFIKTIA